MKKQTIRLVLLLVVGLTAGIFLGLYAAQGRTVSNPTLPTFPPLPTTTPGSAILLGQAGAGQLTISNAYVQATALTAPTAAPTMAGMNMATSSGSMGGMAGMDMSATTSVYLTIHNAGDQPDRLMSIITDSAGQALLHQTIVQNNIAQMVELAGGLAIPAKGSVELKPGGYHIMLSQLKADLVPGETVTLTLTFQSGTIITLNAPVLRP